jgi:hypothetical protein
MILTKNIICRSEAVRLAPAYVAFIEKGAGARRFEKVDKACSKLTKGQDVVTFKDFECTEDGGQYVLCKVSSINRNTYQAIDGPVVRVSNGEYSWRVDGVNWAYPIKEV